MIVKDIKWYVGIPSAVLSALLLLFSFPSFNLNFLAFIALVPILSVAYCATLKKTLAYSVVFAFIFYCLFLFWMNAYLAVVGVLFVTIVFGSCFVISLLLINITSRAFPAYRAMLTPFIWIAIDYVRSFGFLGFTFGSIGYTQHNFPRFIQIADIGGEQLVAFIVLLVNAGLAAILSHVYGSEKVDAGKLIKKIRPATSFSLAAAAALIVFSLIYGTVRLHEPIQKTPSMKLALIQGISSPRTMWKREKWKTLRRLIGLSRESYRAHPDIDLIVWTETAIRTSLRPNLIYGTPYHTQIRKLIQELSTYFIIGSPDNYEVAGTQKVNPDNLTSIYPTKGEEEVWTNSAYYLNPHGEIIAKYDKHKLTPFGEHFPLGQKVRFLQKILDKFTDSAGFTPGNEYTVFEHNPLKFSVVICWEGTYGYFIRKFVLNGADFIINISNDMWTRTRAGHFQHFTMTKFRAIENRIWYVRAGNDGVTAFIDPHGIVQEELPIKKVGYLVGTVGPRVKTTFYTKHGNILPKLSVAVCLTAFIWGIIILVKNTSTPQHRKQRNARY